MGQRKNIVQRKRVQAVKKWIPSIIVMAVIFGLSSITGPVINAAGLNKQVYQVNAHFFLFVILCFTYYKATKNIFNSILLTIIYAVLDETHQIFTLFRSSSTFDIFVDTIAALISGGMLWKYQHILPKKLRNWLEK